MTHWDTAVCETNGNTIHYTRTGGNKPPAQYLKWYYLLYGASQIYYLLEAIYEF